MREKRGSVGDFGQDLTPVEIVLLEDLANILQEINDVTMLLGRTKSPTIPFIDLFTASVVAKLKRLITKNGSGTNLANVLPDKILRRRRVIFNSFPIIDVLLQMVAVLNQKLKKDSRHNYLDEDMAYSMSLTRAVKIIFKLASFFKIKDEETAEPMAAVSKQKMRSLSVVYWMC